MLKLLSCNCKKDCSSAWCGCKKIGLQCTEVGKCSPESCVNQYDTDLEELEADSEIIDIETDE